MHFHFTVKSWRQSGKTTELIPVKALEETANGWGNQILQKPEPENTELYNKLKFTTEIKVEDLEPFQNLLTDQDDEAQSDSGIISEALSGEQSCLESESCLTVRDRGVRDPDWQGLATSGLVESQFRQLHSLLPWNAPQSLDIRENLRESLHSMLSLDERSLHELSLPLPVEEAPEIVPETELVRARKIRISRTDGDVRMMAISKIRSILLSDCSKTELGKTLVPSTECTEYQS